MKNPNWTRDELILALNLYFTHRESFPPKGHPDILLLSDQLNTLNMHLSGKTSSFRNPNGVYMKLNNFKSIDPDYLGTGKVGLWRTSKRDATVWNDYASNPEELSSVAAAILRNLDTSSNLKTSPDLGYSSAKEGKLLERLHLVRERNQRLVKRKKELTIERTGVLQCEACGFCFEAKYGERAKGIIEVHHIRPLHTLTPDTITSLDDLCLLCANCHRVIHTQNPWMTLDQLKSIIINEGRA
jgi:5-methylcytosine-specific restriction protein A